MDEAEKMEKLFTLAQKTKEFGTMYDRLSKEVIDRQRDFQLEKEPKNPKYPKEYNQVELINLEYPDG